MNRQADYPSTILFFRFRYSFICHGTSTRRQRSKVVAKGTQGARPPIEMLFQVFRMNFSWDMPIMHYFSNKFLKIAKRWGLYAPSAS